MAECLPLEQSVLPASYLPSTVPLRAVAPKEARNKSSCKEFRPVAFAPDMPWLDLPAPAPCQHRAVGFFYLLDQSSERWSWQKPCDKWVCRTLLWGREESKNRSSPTACRHETTPRRWDLGHGSVPLYVLLPPKHTCRKKKSCKHTGLQLQPLLPPVN